MNIRVHNSYKPCELPGNLRMHIMRLVPKEGKEEMLDEFLEFLNERGHEAQLIMEKDRMILEAGFRTQEGGKELFYWLQIMGDTPVTYDPEIPVLRDTYAYLEDIFDYSERTVLVPQYAIFSETMEEQMLTYLKKD
ncbi:MAG: DUF6176 family protein [Emergencia sp.]